MHLSNKFNMKEFRGSQKQNIFDTVVIQTYIEKRVLPMRYGNAYV